MILLTIFILIITYSIGYLKNSINSVLFRRISAISLIYAGVLTFNTLYIQSIGSGIGLYSGLFQLSILTSVSSFFILLVSSIIILIWPNINLYSHNFNSFSEMHSTLYVAIMRNLNRGKINYMPNLNLKYVGEEEYSILILFSIMGGLFLIISSDLISLYLSIELQSFGVYILASLYKDKLISTSAGLKYFLLGGLSSCLILLGSGLIYSYTGLTNLESIFNLISVFYKTVPEALNFTTDSLNIFNGAVPSVSGAIDNTNIVSAIKEIFNSIYLADPQGLGGVSERGIMLGLLLVFTGFLFKIAAAPFHNWSPDVYDDSPTIVTTWLTIMPKISILILLMEILIGLDLNIGTSLVNSLSNLSVSEALNDTINVTSSLGLVDSLYGSNLLSSLLLISSLFSLIIGAVVGLNQLRIKRLLAYSTINHVGFLLLCLAVFSNSSMPQALEAFVFYIFQYTITNLNVFLILLAYGYISNINYENLCKSIFNTTNSDSLRGINDYSKIRKDLSSYYAKKKSYIVTYDINYIKSLKGMFFNNPLLSISLSLSLFSFAGVPPLIGFFAKQQVLYSANSAGFYFLSIVAILVSVISASYYLKIVKIITSSPNPLTLNAFGAEQKGAEKSNPLTLQIFSVLSNIHCFLIGSITISLILFIFNPEIIVNSIAILISFILDIKNE